jgi:hypothetical protein
LDLTKTSTDYWLALPRHTFGILISENLCRELARAWGFNERLGLLESMQKYLYQENRNIASGEYFNAGESVPL